MIDEGRVEEIRKRCEKATPEKWKVFRFRGRTDVEAFPHDGGHVSVGTGYDNFADASFVGHARKDIPYLLSELARLQGEVERVERERAALLREMYSVLCDGYPTLAHACAGTVDYIADLLERTPDMKPMTMERVQVARRLSPITNKLINHVGKRGKCIPNMTIRVNVQFATINDASVGGCESVQVG